MYIYRSALALMVLALLMLIGCSSGGSSPLIPSTTPDLTTGQPDSGGPGAQGVNETSQKALWGLWDVECNMETGDLEVNPIRGAEFRANVNTFLNSGPNLQVTILDETNVMVDGSIVVDVGLVHPFPGMYEYSGFDVWGILLHNGSTSLDYNSDLLYASPGSETEAILWNADGYTRWWNRPEFTSGGVLGYTPGAAGNMDAPEATLSPYKVFGDGLGTNDDYSIFLDDPEVIDRRGAFIAGSTNWRTYDLQFPFVGSVPIVRFQYAVVASWEQPTKVGDNFIVSGGGDDWEYFDSAVAEEAICLSVVDNSTLFFDGATGSGNVTFNLEIFDWGALDPVVTMADEIGLLQIECDLFTTPYTYDQTTLAGMAMPGGDFSSTYSFDLTCNPPTDNNPVGVWIIAEQAEGTYENDFGATAPTDPLASFYRMWVPVPSEGNTPPVITSGVDGYDPYCNNSVMDYTVSATGDITGYMWSVVTTGTAKNFSIADDDVLSFDFGTVPLAGYDIDCRVHNGPAFAQATTMTVTVPANIAPVIVSGVTGPASSLPSDSKDYNVVATDLSDQVVMIHEDDFSTDLGWYTGGAVSNWMVYGNQLRASGLGTNYGENAWASFIDIDVPSNGDTIKISYNSTLTIDPLEQYCNYDVAHFLVNKDAGSFLTADNYGTIDQPAYTCPDGWGYDFPNQDSTWILNGFADSSLGIQFLIDGTGDGIWNEGNWVIDDLEIFIQPSCGALTYMWSVVTTGNSPVYDIPDDETLTIDWSTYGVGTWDVCCEVSDGSLTVEATILTVDVVDDSCTNGMFTTNLGTGTHDQPSVHRMDIAFLYGGSHAGECIINQDYFTSGTEYISATDYFHYFDADTTGAKTTTQLFGNNGQGSMFVFAVDELTHNHIGGAMAKNGDDIYVWDQSGSSIFYSDVSHTGGRYNPVLGTTWDDTGNLWFVCACTNGTTQGFPEDDLYHLRWLEWTGSSFSFDQTSGNMLDITSTIGFDIGASSDFFDLEYISTFNELWLLEGGTDGRGAVHRYSADASSGPTYISSFTTIFSSPIAITTFPEIGGYSDVNSFATGADITVDRAAAGADVCRIIIFANLASGGCEIMKYSAGSFGDTQISSDQYAACAINNDSNINTHNLTFLNQGATNVFTIWQPPAGW